MSSEIVKTQGKDGRIWYSRKSTTAEHGERDFDLFFWQEMSPTQRFDATWELVVDAWIMEGNDPEMLKLQKSVEKIKKH